jgi:hypothetical protein
VFGRFLETSRNVVHDVGHRHDADEVQVVHGWRPLDVRGGHATGDGAHGRCRFRRHERSVRQVGHVDPGDRATGLVACLERVPFGQDTGVVASLTADDDGADLRRQQAFEGLLLAECRRRRDRHDARRQYMLDEYELHGLSRGDK